MSRCSERLSAALLLLLAAVTSATTVQAQVYSVNSYSVPSGAYGTSNIAASGGSLWFLSAASSDTYYYGANFVNQVSANGTIAAYSLASISSTNSPIGTSIAAGSDGALWFTAGSGTTAVIGRMTTTGTISTFAIPGGASFTSTPGAITAGPDGALWFTDPSSAVIWRVTTAGVFSSFPLSNPAFGITSGPDGNLWVTEYAIGPGDTTYLFTWNGSVAKVTTAGAESVYALPQQGFTFYYNTESPIDLFTTGPDGALWFTEYNGDQVGRVTTSGAVTTVYNTNFVNGITTGSDGALWLTQPSYTNSDESSSIPALVRLTTGGAVTTQALNTSTFVNPNGITVGPDGALWFDDNAAAVMGHAILTLSVTAACPASTGVQGEAYTYSITTSGGADPLTWSVPAGTLPPGLTLNTATGVISGTPTAPGTYNLNATVTDSSPTPQTATFTCTSAFVIAAPLSVLTTSLPNGSFGVAYPSTTLQAQNGTTPYTWSVSAGSLPAGLTLSGAGVITGTPTGFGTSTFTVKVTDSSTPVQTATQPLSITVTAGAPGSITGTSGSGQSAAINSAFANPLVVTVKDGGGNPVSGATVTFTAPAAGASGTFAGTGTTATATTNASGVATSPTFTADGTTGSYNVSASVSGITAPATFALMNVAGTPASITATSGGGQTTPINNAFGSPLVVTVKDSGGNPVSNATVTFTAPGSGASSTFAGGGTTATATTNASGVATSPTVTANAAVGNYTVNATVGGVTAAAAFTLTNTAGAPASITGTSGGGQTAQVNTAFGSLLVVTVKDAGGNLVPNVSVTFSAPGSGASGTFAGGGTTATAVTNTSGVAMSPAITANGIAGSYTVSASVTGVSPSALFALTNTPGAPASITATSGGGQSAQINNTFGSPLVVTVKDSSGNPVANATVTFSAPGSGASAKFSGTSTTATATTNPSGVATSPAFTANATAGSYNVNATVTGVTAAATFTLTNTAGAPASITATSGGGQSAQINSAFGSPLLVTVKDSGGNPVSNVSVTFTAPPSGASATFAGGGINGSAQTNASGVATSPTVTANATAGAYTVSASVAGLGTSATFGLTNTAGGVASITASSGGGQSARVSTAFTNPLVVVVKDSGGNPVSNVTVAFAAPGSGASGTFAGAGTTVTAQTNGSGLATAPGFTANATAGSYNVNASVGAVGPATFALTNTAGAPGSITATSGGGQSTRVNNAFSNPLVVTVKDSSGNPVSSATVTFAAPGTGASGTFAGAGVTATSTTNGSGVATSPTFTANGTAGGYSVSASVPGAATPAAFGLTNNAGPAASITVASGSNQSARANSAFSNPLVVTVKDASGNLVSGVTVTFAAPGSGASGTFPGAVTTVTAQTNGSGVATSPSFTANGTTGGYNVNATVPGVTAAATFALTNTSGIVITTTALAAGTAGLEYSAILVSQNGTPPYNWTISTGVLPAGLTLNATTGAISGTPTATGTFPFTVKLTDSSTPPQSTTQALSLFINAPVTEPITPSFTISGIPATPAPGASITGGTIQLSPASSAAFAGTLNLGFTPNADVAGVPSGYAGDAGFEVSSGTKVTTLSVTIPAATTSVPVPTVDPGTVAGEVTVALTVGDENVATSKITVAPAAPIIEANSVQITSVTSTGFDVELVATSTTRELTNATFTFTAAAGAQISSPSTFTVDVSTLLSQWFASTSGLTYGGAFTLTLPFTLTGSSSAIQSVSVTLSNSIGTSAAVSGTQ